MGIKVRIPSPLRGLTGGKGEVELVSTTLGECVNELETKFPGLKQRLCDDDGELRRFVNIYINGEDVRFLSGLSTAVKAGDELSIVPAVAGG